MLSFPQVTISRADLGVLAAAACLFYLARRFVERRKANPRGLPLPPGPKGLPLIGNLLQLPLKEPWAGYDRLSKEYGDVMYMEAMGQPILLLGSIEKANDLLEKRSAVYSDRPRLAIFDLMDVNWSFSLMPYGDDWRNHRRAFHKVLGPSTLPRFEPVLDEEVPGFLRNLQENPEAFLAHMREFFGLVSMRIAYGFDDVSVNKNLLRDGEILLRTFGEALVPGRYLVNDIPILRYVPEWLPGAGFMKVMNEMKVLSRRVVFDSFARASEDVRNGRRNAVRSMADELIETMPEGAGKEEHERVARDLCAVVYEAGADTMYGSMSALFLALAMYPEVQRKAQQELDTVIGLGRLPTLKDQDKLPYISAIVKEVGRWYNTTPLGFTHVTSREDEYDGYFIPKGTYCMANIWAIMHDPNTYKDPMTFNPERFLKDGKIDPTVLDPMSVAFGAGRRICPGRFLANNVLFMVAACVLLAYDIHPAKDEHGNPIPLKLEATPYIISSPLPFKADIRLRSPAHAKLFSTA